MKRYAVIMPAKNEEKYIWNALKSVTDQTILPERLVVVSDGSTDNTDDIAREFAERHNFITFRKRENNEPRNFGSKVRAFKEGLEQVTEEYDYLANLDADVFLEPEYYEKVISRFNENHRLGLSGGIINERCGRRKNRVINNVAWSVAGGVQVFRKTPYVIAGAIRFAGYISSKVKGNKVAVSDDVRDFLRQEQWGRLLKLKFHHN